MKRALLFGLAGLFAMLSVVEVEAGHRRCGGRQHRRGGRGCASACYTPCHTNGGCQTGYAAPGYDAPAGAEVQGEAAPAVDDPNVPPPAPAAP